jgi:hypothetical protein
LIIGSSLENSETMASSFSLKSCLAAPWNIASFLLNGFYICVSHSSCDSTVGVTDAFFHE